MKNSSASERVGWPSGRLTRFFLAIIYAFFALVPQAGAVVHTHTGAERSHTHGSGMAHAHADELASPISSRTLTRSRASDHYASNAAEHEAILGFLNAAVIPDGNPEPQPTARVFSPASKGAGPLLAAANGRHAHGDTQQVRPLHNADRLRAPVSDAFFRAFFPGVVPQMGLLISQQARAPPAFA